MGSLTLNIVLIILGLYIIIILLLGIGGTKISWDIIDILDSKAKKARGESQSYTSTSIDEEREISIPEKKKVNIVKILWIVLAVAVIFLLSTYWREILGVIFLLATAYSDGKKK